MLKIFLFVHVTLQISFNARLAETEEVAERNPWAVPTKRISGGKTESDAEVTETQEAETLSSGLVEGSKVIFSVGNECNKNYTIDDGEAILLHSTFKPLGYTCAWNFTHKRNAELRLSCPDVYFRFNCMFESLTIEDENGTYRFCRSEKVPELSATFFSVKYERKLYALHGGFVCFISSTTSSQNGVSQLENKEYIGHETCGEVSAVENSRRKRSAESYLQTKIVGGEDAEMGEYPWMVSLAILVEDNDNSIVYSCGGSLVSDEIVVTASHCLEMDNIAYVEVGLGMTNAESDAEWAVAEKYELHEDYDKYSITNDIAIIYLEEKVDFNNFIHPICLPSEGIRDISGLSATATGWGRISYTGSPTDTLQTVDLSLWSNEQCNSAWKTEYPYAKEEILESQLCAYGVGKDTCSGDSGGPLIIKIQGRWLLVGVTSYGYGCATPGLPGVYTRVSSYSSWITRLTNISFIHDS